MPVARSSAANGIRDPRYRQAIEGLIAARKKAGLSQAAFADALGRHQQFVSRYELGERRLDFVEFIDISRALGVDPMTILALVPEPVRANKTQ